MEKLAILDESWLHEIADHHKYTEMKAPLERQREKEKRNNNRNHNHVGLFSMHGLHDQDDLKKETWASQAQDLSKKALTLHFYSVCCVSPDNRNSKTFLLPTSSLPVESRFILHEEKLEDMTIKKMKRNLQSILPTRILPHHAASPQVHIRT
ncbi:unnamed protein product [Allacma fusca]|uniref:Uncharacterized protein n=1 Tax=Allacma fusca TaxID=39272 RepID=A0A8J2L3W7_9HEXA|nr:unnamed protein product [Allacma fusca]